ncbi:unnamed protein product [Anisakis simplex]|uniref:Eukaryotic translation initiation factor 4H (inferred by orthology to a human protein) n=1 Tax=Anisakis simplex TaxID=6269 RepID=A0A0M3K9U3_ANISI|nr:unnamed protein product [Anisakis simplex]
MAARGRTRKPIPEEGPYKAFVGNLPFDSVQGDIDAIFKDLTVAICPLHFNPHKISIRETRMMRDHESDRFKGFAYVEFATREDLERALELDGCMFDNRVLRIDVADAPRGRSGNRGGFGGRGGGRGGGFRDEGRGGPPSYERQSLDRSDRGGAQGGFSGGRGGMMRGGGSRRGPGGGSFPPPEEEFVAHPAEPGRPRLQLKPRTTDPEELERIKQREEEETKKRQAHIFGADI